MTAPQLIAKSPRLEIYRAGEKQYSLYLNGEYVCRLDKYSDGTFSIVDALGDNELEKFLTINTTDFLDGLRVFFEYDSVLLNGFTRLFWVERAGSRVTLTISIEGKHRYEEEEDVEFIALIKEMKNRFKTYNLEPQDYELNMQDGGAILSWETGIGEYIGALRDTLRDKIKNLMIESGAPAD